MGEPLRVIRSECELHCLPHCLTAFFGKHRIAVHKTVRSLCLSSVALDQESDNFTSPLTRAPRKTPAVFSEPQTRLLVLLPDVL